MQKREREEIEEKLKEMEKVEDPDKGRGGGSGWLRWPARYFAVGCRECGGASNTPLLLLQAIMTGALVHL